MKICRVISGGQSGADQGGLEAARSLGLATGGWAPKNYRTELGIEPRLRSDFKLTEHTSAAYPPRTENNVRFSTMTISFAGNWNSPGEKLTARLAKKHKKPQRCITIRNGRIHATHKEIGDWILENRGRDLRTVINISGNRESVYPGIKKIVRDFLIDVFEYVEDQ